MIGMRNEEHNQIPGALPHFFLQKSIKTAQRPKGNFCKLLKENKLIIISRIKIGK